MALCSHPGCYRNDDEDSAIGNDDVPMYLEWCNGEAWVPVCEEHLDSSNPNAELTDAIAETPTGALTQLLVDTDE